MLELKDRINFHNFMLDLQPKEWFKKGTNKGALEWNG